MHELIDFEIKMCQMTHYMNYMNSYINQWGLRLVNIIDWFDCDCYLENGNKTIEIMKWKCGTNRHCEEIRDMKWYELIWIEWLIGWVERNESSCLFELWAIICILIQQKCNIFTPQSLSIHQPHSTTTKWHNIVTHHKTKWSNNQTMHTTTRHNISQLPTESATNFSKYTRATSMFIIIAAGSIVISCKHTSRPHQSMQSNEHLFQHLPIRMEGTENTYEYADCSWSPWCRWCWWMHPQRQWMFYFSLACSVGQNISNK